MSCSTVPSRCGCVCLPLSLAHSLILFLSVRLILSLAYSLSLSLAYSLSLSLSLSLCVSSPFSHSLFLSLTHSVALSLAHSGDKRREGSSGQQDLCPPAPLQPHPPHRRLPRYVSPPSSLLPFPPSSVPLLLPPRPSPSRPPTPVPTLSPAHTHSHPRPNPQPHHRRKYLPVHARAHADNLYTKEEMKVTWECQKIMELPNLPVSCTVSARMCSLTIECVLLL